MQESDAPALRAIYAPYVLDSAASFEETVPTEEEFAARVHKYLSAWAGVVAEVDGRVVGYAYGGPHRERAAYRWSVETSAYVHAGHHGRGIGRRLYEALLPELSARGYCNAYAGITLPNDASVALHEAVGFARIGVFPRVGHKFGRWHDVAWLHRVLRQAPPA